MAVEAVSSFWRGDEHLLLPEELAGFRVEAEQQSLFGLLDRGGQEYAIAPDNRRRMTLAGYGCFPEDVVGIAPADGHGGFEAAAVAPRTSPAGPVFRSRGWCSQEE